MISSKKWKISPIFSHTNWNIVLHLGGVSKKIIGGIFYDGDVFNDSISVLMTPN